MDSVRRSLRAPVAVLCAALALSLVACGGGSEAATTRVPAGATVKIEPGAVQVEAAGLPGALADADRDAIIETLRRYVVAATIAPLRGKPIGDLEGVFTAEAMTALAGPDRAAAIDEGMPKATARVKAVAPPVPLVALSDQAGAIDLVGTTLFLDVNTKASGGPVRVQRSGELVFKRDAEGWKISSYRLAVDRTGSGLATATTSSTEKRT